MVGSSERSEFEHTSSPSSGVWCAGDIAVGLLSHSATRTPRSASCHAASLPAMPAPTTVTSGSIQRLGSMARPYTDRARLRPGRSACYPLGHSP